MHLVLGAAGDRTDDLVRSLGEIAARDADVVVIVHKHEYLRGRDPEEMTAIYREGAATVGVRAIAAYDSELAGLEALLARAVPRRRGWRDRPPDRELLDDWLVQHGAAVGARDVLRDKVVVATPDAPDPDPPDLRPS